MKLATAAPNPDCFISGRMETAEEPRSVIEPRTTARIFDDFLETVAAKVKLLLTIDHANRRVGRSHAVLHEVL